MKLFSNCIYWCDLTAIGRMGWWIFTYLLCVAIWPVYAQESEDHQTIEEVHKHGPHHRPGLPGPQRITEELRTPNGFNKPWWKWEHATGDWGGGRPWFDERGITLEVGYSANFFYNLRGGLNTSDADQYRGILDLSLTIDTEVIGLWESGTFFLDFQQIHGRDISERHVGDIQALNNADAPDRTQLAEFWYEHSRFDGKMRFKLGKMDANADFAYVEYGLEHIHSSAGFMPTIPLTTFPDPALGAAVFVEPTDSFFFGAGIYDGHGEGNRGGFETAFHGPDSSVTIFEVGFRPTLEMADQQLPGTYRAGGWYHSDSWDVFFDDLDGERSPRTHRGNAGVYLNLDQLLYRENPELEDDQQGLGAFFQFGWAPSAYNEISQYYGFGGQYVGLIPTRDEDITGFGFYHVSLSGMIQSLENRHSETAMEFFHKIQLTPFLNLKPDLQYIINPGGDGKNALVAGIRIEMTL